MKMVFLTLAALSLAFVHAQGIAGTSEILLSQSTESESLPGSVVPERAMIKSILSSYDKEDQITFREMLNECVTDKKQPQHQFFLKKKLPSLEEGKAVYFVRPSVKPYCGAFYGAHIFQFWLVSQKNKVLYSGGADSVTIFKTTHNGMYDIEVMHGGGWGISETKLEFDGHKYKPLVCKETRFDNKGREVTKRVNCS